MILGAIRRLEKCFSLLKAISFNSAGQTKDPYDFVCQNYFPIERKDLDINKKKRISIVLILLQISHLSMLPVSPTRPSSLVHIMTLFYTAEMNYVWDILLSPRRHFTINRFTAGSS